MKTRASTDFSDPARRIVVALDVSEQEDLVRLVKTLRGAVGMFKVGKELFCSMGPDAVKIVQDHGGEVFLDLKFHDIPNTVAGAVRSSCKLGVSMFTVHASGGMAMMKAAVEEARSCAGGPMVIGVTVLTSLSEDDLDMLGLAGPAQSAVVRLGRMAMDCGLDGLVASPQELRALRAELGKAPFLVTPGIRPLNYAADDQQRIATPKKAVVDGADFLVIGRPITRAVDPLQAVDAIAEDLVQD